MPDSEYRRPVTSFINHAKSDQSCRFKLLSLEGAIEQREVLHWLRHGDTLKSPISTSLWSYLQNRVSYCSSDIYCLTLLEACKLQRRIKSIRRSTLFFFFFPHCGCVAAASRCDVTFAFDVQPLSNRLISSFFCKNFKIIYPAQA